MTLRTTLSLAFALAAACPAAAPAEAAECDCSRRVGLCQAEARYDGKRIFFTSQTDQCSRISFSLDDHVASITIQQGRGSVSFAASRAVKDSFVPVEACYVCEVSGTPR